MTVLAVFGCSWTSGPGTFKYHNTFGQQLAEKLGATEFVNLGLEGSSNSRSVLQLIDYVKRTDLEIKNSTAVFLITTPSRDCIFDQDTKNIIDLRSDNKDNLTQSWLEYFSAIETENFLLHRNILSMQAMCRQYHIKDYYISAWSDIDFNLPGVDTNKIYPQSCVQLFGYKNMWEYLDNDPNQYIRPNCGHPNDLGNQIISQTLYNWISSDNVQTQI
jgi:hypothetical protein